MSPRLRFLNVAHHLPWLSTGSIDSPISLALHLMNSGSIFAIKTGLGASDELFFRTALSIARNCADTGPVSCRCLYETLV